MYLLDFTYLLLFCPQLFYILSVSPPYFLIWKFFYTQTLGAESLTFWRWRTRKPGGKRSHQRPRYTQSRSWTLNSRLITLDIKLKEKVVSSLKNNGTVSRIRESSCWKDSTKPTSAADFLEMRQSVIRLHVPHSRMGKFLKATSETFIWKYLHQK